LDAAQFQPFVVGALQQRQAKAARLGRQGEQHRRRHRKQAGNAHQSSTTTLCGTRPTGIVFSALAAAVSMTVTSSDKPFVTNRRLPSRFSAMPQARLPTSTSAPTLRLGTSTKATWLARPRPTY